MVFLGLGWLVGLPLHSVTPWSPRSPGPPVGPRLASGGRPVPAVARGDLRRGGAAADDAHRASLCLESVGGEAPSAKNREAGGGPNMAVVVKTVWGSHFGW